MFVLSKVVLNLDSNALETILFILPAILLWCVSSSYICDNWDWIRKYIFRRLKETKHISFDGEWWSMALVTIGAIVYSIYAISAFSLVFEVIK